MPDMNDSDGFLDRPVFALGEDGADVEGHIHRDDAARVLAGADDIRIAAAEDGPDVEGHIRPAHAGIEDIRIAAAEDAGEDGPDVEGHIFRA